MGSEKVLENFSWRVLEGPGFFSSERVGTLTTVLNILKLQHILNL